MIVQVLLSLGLLTLAGYAWLQRARARVLSWAMILICAFGEVLVLNPELATRIAHWMGVGRGADLVVYCFIVASLGLIMNLHLRLHALHEDFTELARRVALRDAREPSAPAPVAELTPR
ncbi:MAG: DUF2304 domain-containing protein [Rhodospirillaceae bacterium]|nr:DUF2304 domain-containing protein [Rhodospirillaceae bacterium]